MCRSSTLATATMSPGAGLGDVLGALALHEQVADAQRLPGPQVDQRCGCVESSRNHADEAQVADELVGDGLEHLADELACSVGSSWCTVPLAPPCSPSQPLARTPATGRISPGRRAIPRRRCPSWRTVQKIGMSVPAASACGMAASSSSTVTEPSVRYFSIRASSDSTTASISCWRAAAAVDRATGRHRLRRIEHADDVAEARPDRVRDVEQHAVLAERRLDGTRSVR